MSKSKTLCTALLTVGAAFAAAAPAQAAPWQWSVTISAPLALYPAAPIARQAPVVGLPAYRPVAYQQPTRWDRDGDRHPEPA